jgi:phosphoglycolate phosphatase-like HAD superfamily hydrolase
VRYNDGLGEGSTAGERKCSGAGIGRGMTKKLILFDLDGTLLWSDGAGRAAIHRALVEEMGTAGPIEGYSFAGKTDTAITRDLLRAANHPDAESHAHVMRVCARYVERLRGELRSPQRHVRVYVGVHELLALLGARDDAVVGLLTGNLEQGATLKLEAAGIDPAQFRVAAYGSEAYDRAELPPIAVKRAVAVMGGAPLGEDVVIIGDTPADMTCGRAIGARAIGVATGPFDVAALKLAGGHFVFGDFSKPEEVVAAIFA